MLGAAPVAVVDGVLLNHPTAVGPAGEWTRPLPASQRLHQGMQVVAPVTQAAGGVDRLALGPAEGAQVGGDQPVAVGEPVGHVLPEAAGGDVAVDQQHRHPVGGPLTKQWVRMRLVSTITSSMAASSVSAVPVR